MAQRQVYGQSGEFTLDFSCVGIFSLIQCVIKTFFDILNEGAGLVNDVCCSERMNRAGH